MVSFGAIGGGCGCGLASGGGFFFIDDDDDTDPSFPTGRVVVDVVDAPCSRLTHAVVVPAVVVVVTNTVASPFTLVVVVAFGVAVADDRSDAVLSIDAISVFVRCRLPFDWYKPDPFLLLLGMFNCSICQRSKCLLLSLLDLVDPVNLSSDRLLFCSCGNSRLSCEVSGNATG